MRIWRNFSFLLSTLVAVTSFTGCSNTEEYSRAGGDAIGKKCTKVAFTVDRFKLEYSIGDRIYSLFYASDSENQKSGIIHTLVSFLGDGYPNTTEISTDIYTINIKSKKIDKLNTILPPEDWKNNAVSYSTKARVLPSGEILLTMRGCKKEATNCNNTKFFKIEKTAIQELQDLPRYKKRELREQSICASNTTHNVNNAIISYGSIKTGAWIEIANVDNGAVTIK